VRGWLLARRGAFSDCVELNLLHDVLDTMVGVGGGHLDRARAIVIDIFAREPGSAQSGNHHGGHVIVVPNMLRCECVCVCVCVCV
jgi:hypothetical protein